MRLLFLSALLSSALGAVVLAAKEQRGAPEPTTRPTSGPVAPSAPPLANAHCPVERENLVDPHVTVEQDGKAVGFCCRDCIKDFRKDPHKYLVGLK